MGALRKGSRAIAVLDADPDLGSQIAEPALDEARRVAVARALEVEGHRWEPGELEGTPDSGWLGLLVTKGVLIRRVAVASRLSCELLGQGDVLRPWDEGADYGPLEVQVDWLVLTPVQMAVLDRGFSVRVARWPSISDELIRRVAARARYLAITAAVTHIPRTHVRLLFTFWLLATRWGVVTAGGVAVRLPLTHQVLAMLIGSHRPSVTTALKLLDQDGLVVREGRERWLITTRAIEMLYENLDEAVGWLAVLAASR